MTSHQTVILGRGRHSDPSAERHDEAVAFACELNGADVRAELVASPNERVAQKPGG